MTTSKASVTAVIVTYQSRRTIGAALDTLREAHDAGFADCVVVDNVSDDGTADFVAQTYPWVRLIRSPSNIGFGRGCNLGVASVSTPYVLLLNPDAAMKFDSIGLMHEFFEHHPGCSMVAPAIIESDLSLQDAGLMLTPATLLRSVFRMGNPFPDRRSIVPGGEPFRTTWICGAVMLMRTTQYRSLGGFDPRFFLYFEETDLCRRFIQNGGEIWTVGQAIAHHIGGASARSEEESMESNCIAEHFYRSRFYFLAKHYGRLTAVFLETLDAVSHGIRRLRWACCRTGKSGNAEQRPRRPFLQMPTQPEKSE